MLPQGQPERDHRALSMVAQMNAEGFGGCTNIGECTGACPEGDSAGSDCDHESRLHSRELEAARPGSPDSEADDRVEHGIEAEDRSPRYKLRLRSTGTSADRSG